METAGTRMKAERAQLLAKASLLTDGAKAAARDLTTQEKSDVEGHLARVDEIDTTFKSMESDQARLRKLAQLSGDFTQDGKGFFQLNAKAITADLLGAHHGESGPGIKALVGAGESTVGIPLLSASPVDMGKIATSLLDVLPAQQVAREFSYLRQTARTNNAAVVASGGLKPTSVYTLERIEEHLRVIAHLSEPIDKFWLEDDGALGQFVGSELVYGLQLGIENQILNGNGLTDNFTGLNVTSGIQTQAWTVDMITTARNGLTQAQTAVGEGPGFYVFNPFDWAKIELTTVGSAYAMNSGGANVPVDQAARKLWGSPVVLSNAQAAGYGLYAQRESVRVFASGSIKVEWNASGDDFQRNLLRARCEGRFGFAVPRPLGVVRLDLTAL
ncbi:MAG: phage major capsid protein [Rhodoglobus sp.]